MKNLNKALRAGLIAGAAMLSTHASAAGLWNPCCDLDGCWELGVEALYWKPCICEWEYGLQTSVDSNDERVTTLLAVNPDYDWGFRILGSYISCSGCKFLTLDWIYLRNADYVWNAPFTSINTTVLDSASRLKFRYNRINLRGGYYLHRGCNLDFYVFAGIRWINLDQRRRIDGQAGGTRIVRYREKTSFDGAGLEFGVGGEYRTQCGLSLVGRLAPTVALGERKHNFTQSINLSQSEAVGFPRRTLCAPGLDFRLGLSYGIDCACFSVVGEIGYELNYYFFLFTSVTRLDDDSANAFFSTSENIGFAGPYASLRVRF